MTAATTARRLDRLPAPVVDLGLAVAVAVVFAAGVGVGREPDGRGPDLVAYGLGAALAGVVVLRRRWPLAVLLVSAALLGAYHALDYPPVGFALTLAVALFTATAAGHLRAAAVVIVLLLVSMLPARVGLEGESWLAVGEDAAREGATLFAVVLLAEAIRARRALGAEVAERLRRVARDRERAADERVAEERLRIAREFHDVMAHTVAVIAVQAGVAVDVLDDSPEQARTALRTLRTASREAMAELAATVGLLRGGSGGTDGTGGEAAPLAPAPGLGQLDALVATAAAAGVQVAVAVEGAPRPLPATVELTAYRVVQESLTNVIRHAGAARATVTVRFQGDEVRVEVLDDGPAGGLIGASSAVPSAGNGLTGMAERVTALGGRIDAGPRATGGFAVAVRLPAAPA